MKQNKQLLNKLGCFSPHLSQHLLRLLLLLVTLGGVTSSWAEDVTEAVSGKETFNGTYVTVSGNFGEEIAASTSSQSIAVNVNDDKSSAYYIKAIYVRDSNGTPWISDDDSNNRWNNVSCDGFSLTSYAENSPVKVSGNATKIICFSANDETEPISATINFDAAKKTSPVLVVVLGEKYVTPTQYTAPTITVNGNWMIVSQPEGQGATMFWKYTRTKAGDISDTNHDAGDGTTEDSKGFYIPYGRYPADFIQAICVDITNPTGEGSRTSEITKYGTEITVTPPQPTVEMSGTNKVKFTMNGQTTSCYFEYKIGESGETHQVFNTNSHEIDITSGEKIYVWVSASYKYKDEGEEKTDYVGCDPVEFTPTYTAPVDPTKVGTEDNSTSYGGAHSQVYTLAAGKTRHIEFKNYSAKTQNWDNWVLSIGSTEDLAIPTKADDYADIMMLRPDNYDIIKKSQIAHEITDWNAFKNDMDGSTVVMDVTNSGKHIYVNATITKDAKTYKYSAICNDRADAGTDVFFCFTVERSHITDLSVGEEADAYELTYGIKELGTDNYESNQCGTISIKNAQGLPLRKGTYAVAGETVNYKAEAKEGYVFYQWGGSGVKAADRNITLVDGAIASGKVNPTAEFLSKPGVATPENIVTLTHPASTLEGFKMYFTLDNSDPKTSASRYEYSASNLVAIRENIGKVRAVAFYDGVYSAIQGTNVIYEPVTVLEARGEGISAGDTFTGNTCTTSINISNGDAETSYTNAKSPNSLIDVNEKIYRGQTEKNQIIIGLNSTSAKKFVVGFVSNANAERKFSSLSVDGANASCTTNNKKNSSQTNVERLVITPASEIEQGSEVTFTFNGNVKITYIEVFGTSLEQCEAPIIAPYQYDATDGWSYQIIPVEGTTLNYTIDGGDVQTSTSTITIPANAVNVGQIIRAWSTKDGWGGSTRTKYTDAATIEPVLKFSPSTNATYNKANSTWEAGVAPTFKVYPESLLNSVTYETEETNIGHAENKNGQGEIILGSGQGIAKITASLTVEGTDGLTNGTYTSELTLTLADGFADKLPANYTPKVGETRLVKDNDGNVVLTLNIGGWTHGSNGTSWKNDNNGSAGSTLTDTWPKTGPYVKGTAIDGYSQQSQAKTDARSETKGIIVWKKKYEKVAPYSLPCRGAYITVTPEKNGQLTIYLVQNGCIDEDVTGEPLCGSPRVYYWFDSEGNCIPSETRLEQKFGYTYGSYETQLESNWKLSTNSDLKQKVEQYWKNKTEDDLEEAIPYQGGYFLIKKAYIKYVVTLLAGKTYYFFSNGSKMGYSGLNFAPSDEVSIKLPEGGTQTVSTEESLALNDEVNFSAPSSTTAYNEVTLNRTFKANTWNTICLPISVSKEQVERVFGKGTVFVGYNGFSENTLHLVYHAYDYILPGQPYFIKPTGEGVDMTDGVIDNIVFKGVTITSNAAVKDNDDKNDDFQFIGLFNGTTIQPYDHYMGGSGNIVFSSTKSIALKGYRAYLKNNTGGDAQVKAIAYSNFDDDMDEPTAIDDLMVYLENEGVQVIPVAGVYNLNGQKVADEATNLPAGIYIIKGKKVVVK